ncbi:MAG: hypothetical protein BWK72_12340 [Rhodoferax ferrireducens]|uniref:BLUF domain-containing protein n=1 Tax=Rhodoferax ferrireducens TaxID=192843 RepID=A0A1W9KTF2_9BURK|nr:MAG: hypothetical protein BWK72_12340 [Rhodoferax ferrireducens]
MSLVQLIYVSDLVNNDESLIPAILATSLRRNPEDGITGMLLYSHGNFLQVLEGEQAEVDATYARICQDPRHPNTVMLAQEPVKERHFAQWSMGFRRLSPEHAASLPQYAPFFQFGFDAQAIQAKPGVALEMLQLFSQGML